MWTEEKIILYCPQCQRKLALKHTVSVICKITKIQIKHMIVQRKSISITSV